MRRHRIVVEFYSSIVSSAKKIYEQSKNGPAEITSLRRKKKQFKSLFNCRNAKEFDFFVLSGGQRYLGHFSTILAVFLNANWCDEIM